MQMIKTPIKNRIMERGSMTRKLLLKNQSFMEKNALQSEDHSPNLNVRTNFNHLHGSADRIGNYEKSMF